MEQANQKIIGTRRSTDYSFLFQNQKLSGIFAESPEKSIFYSFYPKEDEPKVSNEILEVALRALLESNPTGFDILSACFYGLKEQEEYQAIAVKVFKEHWNKLYNLVFADIVFERESFLDSLDETYDFWKENK